MYELEILLY